MQTVTTALEYDALYKQWNGRQIALVPTMGALHEGHQALIRRARQLADIVVVSIFVNPLQFGPQEDLSRYPRPIGQDMGLCRELGVDAVLCPTVETMYPEGMENTTTVVPPACMTDILCGLQRPGHFTGVATVVLKLLTITRPHTAVFGEKDAQQLAIIRRMVRDLNLPVRIAAHPIVRDSQGLALSSRNVYLQSETERKAALALSRILQRIREQAHAIRPKYSMRAVSALPDLSGEVLAEMGETGAFVEIEYLEARHKETLAPVELLGLDTKLLIAGRVGTVRLIDNLDID